MSVSDRHDSNRELFGQGLANVVAPVFGGVAATGAIARTAVNVRAGGVSRLAAIVHALILAVIAFAAAPLVGGIPVAALAGVLIATAIRMVEYTSIAALARSGRGEAFVAMRVSLAQLGMRTEQQDQTLGYLAVAGNAPAPLSDDEWRTASQADLPLLRKLIAPHVGAAANFVQFEPQGLEVVINATFLDAPRGTEVSLTVRLREIAPPRSGWPRRDYVAPQLLTVGIDKIFTTFERELKAAPRR